MIEAKIILDSVAPSQVRLTTFVLTYPRFIHSELLTHRVFSRNASSSRAIPVKKQIQMVIDNPAIPIKFHKNIPGMQGGEELIGEDRDLAVELWLEGRDAAVEIAKRFVERDIAKQVSNRVLEPYAHISVVLTSTEFANWFGLRYHKDAQPEICELAKQMYNLYVTHKPQELQGGNWHLPFITEEDYRQVAADLMQVIIPTKEEMNNILKKRSVAKCARVSYLTHEGKSSTTDQDLQLYERLVGASPIHASPTEHQAMAVSDPNFRSGNFTGWLQYRKTLENENITKFSGPT